MQVNIGTLKGTVSAKLISSIDTHYEIYSTTTAL